MGPWGPKELNMTEQLSLSLFIETESCLGLGIGREWGENEREGGLFLSFLK